MESNNQNPELVQQSQGKMMDENNDIDSVVSDRCWEPKHRTSSRKWLTRDGNSSSLHTEQVSTMKYNYTNPQPTSPIMGRRAKILLKQMIQEAEMEVKSEKMKKPDVEKYITTYDDTYCVSDPPNFVPKPLPRLREKYEEYPLYGNVATTYWQFQHEKSGGDRRSIQGVTPIVDINNPFKRNTKFSKPMEDCMDGRQVDC